MNSVVNIKPSARDVQPRISVEDHLGLIRMVARRYCPSSSTNIEDTDEYSVGQFGLLKAIKNYQPHKGLFSTYACKCIGNEIVNYLKHENKRRMERIGSRDFVEQKQVVFPVELLDIFLAPDSSDTESDLINKSILQDRFIHGKSWIEIARQKGVSSAAVMQRANKAIGLIKNRFSEMINSHDYD